jgi:hypothetical protein
MEKKQKLTDQYRKLYEAKEWAGDKLRQEDDRQVRDALFAAMQAIGLGMLKLEKVAYLTVDQLENLQEDK